MKKLLLFSSVLLAGACVVIAQSTVPSRQTGLRPSFSNIAYPIEKNILNEISFPNSTSHSSPPSTRKAPLRSLLKKTPSPLASKVVGFTCFDVESYNSMGRNIINHGDGTLSFVFNVDDECSASYANRGSGYNYWNGTALLYPGGATQRIELTRTGFSQIALLGTGSEIIMAHNTPPYDFKKSTNGTKGTSTWTGINVSATLPASSVPGYTSGTTEQAPWARIAKGGADGNSIHLLANYYQGATNPPPGPVIKGVLAPMVYSRSTNGGVTWDLQSIMLPGYDSTRTLSGDAETYSIDAEGTTVAILHGGLGEDLTLWKSTDNGTTFLRTFVDSFAFAPSFDSTGGPADTAKTNDGGMSVVVAPNGDVHVAFSTERVCCNTTSVSTDNSYEIFPGDTGLVYWNDVTKQQVNIPIPLSGVDATINGGNNNNAYDVGVYTTNINANNGSTPPSARYGSKALLSIPSIAVDGNNVFILFSLVTDADSTSDGQNFRDVWVVASQDYGLTWGTVQNVTCSVATEEYFISLAKRVDNYLHFIYQLDYEPGTSLQNGDPITPDNEIDWALLDKAVVLAGTANCGAGFPGGVAEQSTPAFSVSESYPNPTNGMTYFDIRMKQNADVAFEMFNSLGQQVYSKEVKLAVGQHTLSVDASKFSGGLYFYTIKSGNASVVSGKFTVAE